MEGVKVDDASLNECISSLKSICIEDGMPDLISGLENEFKNCNSETTNAFVKKVDEYTKVNTLLNNIATNFTDVLEKAKIIYENTDSGMADDIK